MRSPTLKYVILGVLACVALGLVALSTDGRASEAGRRERPARRVTTAAVQLGPTTQVFRAHGAARARDRAMLSFTVPGRLVARPVRVGDRVEAGQLLARIDGRGFGHGARAAAATARQAEAQLSMQERDRQRLTELDAAEAVSKAQIDRIGTAVEAARAQRDAADVQRLEAERNLRETELRAPFAGTVVAVKLEVGEFAGPGQPVIVISGDAGLEVEVDVPGRIARSLRPGAKAELRFPLDTSRAAQGRVLSVALSAAGPGRMFPVIVTLEDDLDLIHPGSATEVRFELTSEPLLTVPASAVVAPAGVDAAVFRVTEGRAERVFVELLRLLGERVAVRGELRHGDRVITAGYTGLVDGERVEEAKP